MTFGVIASATAQPEGRIYRLAVLAPGEQDRALDSGFGTLRSVTFAELARRGYVDGRNLVILVRGDPTEQLPKLARELVALAPDAMIAVTTQAAQAAKEATEAVPIVMSFSGEDPVEAGLVSSLAHPGNNVTGLVMLATELDAKRLDLLREAVPAARRVAVLGVSPARNGAQLEAMRLVAAHAGLDLVPVYATRPAELEGAFASMRAAGAQALAIVAAPEFSANPERIAELALAARLPTMCEWGFMAEHGCLLGYGPSIHEMRVRTAEYVVRLFKGASPGELPIERPTRFEFVVNLKTGRTLGIDVPHQVLLRADEVID